MEHVTTVSSTLLASFLASFVEIVEAFTIVLAVGLTQNWRSAWIGTGLALVLLVALVLIFGPLLQVVPIAILQGIVGILLGLFGMRWLRKAILRASGYIPLHDENLAFRAEAEHLRSRRNGSRANYLAMLSAFKAIMLEGIEVVFIVIAVGSPHGLTLYASFGALLAFGVVMLIGLVVHRPLSRIPENSLKLVVGVLLTSFSLFWIGEALGVAWPGADAAILGFVVVLAGFATLAIRALKSHREVIRLGGPVKGQTL